MYTIKKRKVYAVVVNVLRLQITKKGRGWFSGYYGSLILACRFGSNNLELMQLKDSSFTDDN